MKEHLIEIIKSKDLKEITTNIIEDVLDSKISDEIIKEIPILKSLIAVRNIYSSISDRIFIKKALNVLLELGGTDINLRKQFLKEFSDAKESGYEKIIIAIDHIETLEKCRIFGRLCKLKIDGNIDKDSFLRLSKVIQDAYVPDLYSIKDFEKNNGEEIYEGDYLSLVTSGLIYQVPSEQEPIKYIPEHANDYGINGPSVEGGKIKFNYYLSDVGKVLLSFFDELIDVK